MNNIFTPNENSIKDFILAKNTKNRTHIDLQFLANRIRKHIVYMTFLAGSGHPGGALGLADIFCVLYFYIMKYDIEEHYLHPNNDYLFLSNGHVCAVRYASMAIAGFFSESELKNHRKYQSRLQGHPSTRFFPEIMNSSGSLGQGLSVASGFALAKNLQQQQGNHSQVFVSISDGECQEGMIWEAILSCAQYNTNITVFVDYNGIQIDGYTKDIMHLGELSKKLEAFQWKVKSSSGHDYAEIIDSFFWAEKQKNAPRIIIFHNTLGKGVSFMENQPKWHGTAPQEKDLKQALAELDKEQKQIIQSNIEYQQLKNI